MELLPNATVPFLSLFNRREPHVHAIKRLLLQGVAAVQLLRSVGWEHNDLGDTNMVVATRVGADGSTHYQLVLFDLGNARRVQLPDDDDAGTNTDDTPPGHRQPVRLRAASASTPGGQARSTEVDNPPTQDFIDDNGWGPRSMRPNGHHSDLYTFAKSFYIPARYVAYRLYRGIGKPGTEMLPPRYADSGDPTTLLSALWHIVRANAGRYAVPDFDDVIARVRAVEKLTRGSGGGVED